MIYFGPSRHSKWGPICAQAPLAGPTVYLGALLACCRRRWELPLCFFLVWPDRKLGSTGARRHAPPAQAAQQEVGACLVRLLLKIQLSFSLSLGPGWGLIDFLAGLLSRAFDRTREEAQIERYNLAAAIKNNLRSCLEAGASGRAFQWHSNRRRVQRSNLMQISRAWVRCLTRSAIFQMMALPLSGFVSALFIICERAAPNDKPVEVSQVDALQARASQANQ